MTYWRTDGPTKRGVESRSTRVKSSGFNLLFFSFASAGPLSIPRKFQTLKSVYESCVNAKIWKKPSAEILSTARGENGRQEEGKREISRRVRLGKKWNEGFFMRQIYIWYLHTKKRSGECCFLIGRSEGEVEKGSHTALLTSTFRKRRKTNREMTRESWVRESKLGVVYQWVAQVKKKVGRSRIFVDDFYLSLILSCTVLKLVLWSCDIDADPIHDSPTSYQFAHTPL